MLDKFSCYRREPWGLLKKLNQTCPHFVHPIEADEILLTKLILDCPIYVNPNLSILLSRGDVHGLELCSSRYLNHNLCRLEEIWDSSVACRLASSPGWKPRGSHAPWVYPILTKILQRKDRAIYPNRILRSNLQTPGIWYTALEPWTRLSQPSVSPKESCRNYNIFR